MIFHFAEQLRLSEDTGKDSFTIDVFVEGGIYSLL